MEKIILHGILLFNVFLQIWYAETGRQPFKDEQAQVLDTEDGYRTYYISSNGTDVSTCGKTMYTACKTLEHALSLYYNTTHPPEKGLEIITSKSLVIDAQLMGKYQAFRRSFVEISSLETESNRLPMPTIGIEGVDFLDSKWELVDINVNMTKTNASLMTLNVFSSQKNHSENHELNVYVDKCIFGQWNLMGISKITITNSSIIDLNTEKDQAILSISKSTVWMENITIQGMARTKIIEVNSGSIISIGGSTFSENKARNGVINLANQSFLAMNGCHLHENKAFDWGGVIHSSNSIVRTENSRFENNSAFQGGAIYFSNQSTLQINNSNFTQNTAIFGGAVCGENNVDAKITNSHFLSNVATGGHHELSKLQRLQQIQESKSAIYLPISPAFKNDSSTAESSATEPSNIVINAGGAIWCRDNCTVNCSDTIFFGNIATKHGTYNKSLYEPLFLGGAISLYNYSTLNNFNATFRQNSAPTLGGAISASILSSVNLENSLLEDNTVLGMGGGVALQDNSTAVIKGSTFINNSAADYGGAVSVYLSKLNVTSSTFNFNRAYAGYGCGGAVGSSNSFITITFCTFAKNSVTMGGAAISVIDYSQLYMSNTRFIHNMKRTGRTGGKIDSAYSNVKIDNCLFSGNTNGAILTNKGTLVVTNSKFINNSQSNYGGALYIQETLLYLKNVTFCQNTAPIGGAVRASSNVTITITDSVFQGNDADISGGAINLEQNCYVLVYNTNFTNNKARGKGGAISARMFVDVFMTSCSLDENYSGNIGGAIYLEASSKTSIFELCKFNLNNAKTEGGAIGLSRGNLQAQNAYFENNLAGNNGGAIMAHDNSIINISDSNFTGNKVLYLGNGGAISIYYNATAYLSNIVLDKNTAVGQGGALASRASNLYLNRSRFESNSNSKVYGGAVYIRDHSLVSVENSVFRNNSGDSSGSVFVEASEAHFEKCLFDRNFINGRYAFSMGGALAVFNANISISYSDLSNNSAEQGEAIYATTNTQTLLYTYISSFTSTKNITLNSSESNFVQKAEKENIIYLDGKPALIEETPYASVIPRKCLHDCLCYHSVKDRANIFNCKEKNLTALPETVLNGTDWLVATENSLGEIREVKEYLSDVIHIDLSSSHINSISENVMSSMLEKTIYLNIKNNNLTYLPKSIVDSLNVTNLLISENPYECNCDMLWMRDWLVQATNVMDKENVTCATGKWKGMSIYQLDRKAMGCLFPLWTIITVAVGTVLIITVTFISFKKWETIKFLLFWHLNVLTNDDGPENLDDIKFDAFISCSQADESFVESDIIEYLENLGFKICTHHRDFMPGTNIAENIADAIMYSRRMIVVISRSYTESRWCMKEFRDAHAHITDQNRKKFLIPLLFEEINTAGLDEDLKLYIETHTYIECKDLGKMKKRLRYSMPHKLLSKYKAIEEEPEFTDENEATDYGATFVETRAKKNGSRDKPPEGACGGDIEGGTDEMNVNERTPLVQ